MHARRLRDVSAPAVNPVLQDVVPGQRVECEEGDLNPLPITSLLRILASRRAQTAKNGHELDPVGSNC